MLVIDFDFLVVPPEKPPPLKYHLFTQKLPPSNNVAEESEGETEDDIESKVTEERQQHSGSIVYTVECQVISPGTVIPGVLAITSDSLYFTADEEAPDMKKINQEVSFWLLDAVILRRNWLKPILNFKGWPCVYLSPLIWIHSDFRFWTTMTAWISNAHLSTS